MADNFLPNVKCPHCGRNVVVAISGFGSELNTREKFCSKCNRPFFLNILVRTSLYKTPTDGEIRDYEGRIHFLQKQRMKTLAARLIEYKVARQINEQALRMAEEMYRKRLMN